MMAATGLVLLVLAVLVDRVSDEYRWEVVAAILGFVGALLLVSSLAVFLWRYAP